MTAPKFSSYKELKNYFTELLGADTVLATSTGRPYVKIAQKGDAVLLMNVALDHVMYKGQDVRSVCARFFQRGGTAEGFVPPLKVRATSEDESVRRLSKHQFPLCPIHPAVNPVEQWKAQNIEEQMVSWVKGVIGFASAEPVSDDVIRTLVNLHIPEAGAFDPPKPEDIALFNLDVQIDEEEPKQDPVPAPGESDEPAPPTPTHLN